MNTDEEKKFDLSFISQEKVAEILGQIVYEDDVRDRIISPGIAIGMVLHLL